MQEVQVTLQRRLMIINLLLLIINDICISIHIQWSPSFKTTYKMKYYGLKTEVVSHEGFNLAYSKCIEACNLNVLCHQGLVSHGGRSLAGVPL
jgi:hypothetical protein